jgi:hypothetical protein
MDLIFILTTSMACYNYDPELRARTQFITDRRLMRGRWTRSEGDHYRKAISDCWNNAASVDIRKRLSESHGWHNMVFDENRAREPEKTLIEMEYGSVTVGLLQERIEKGYFRGDRPLFLSFFHNDEDTGELMYGNCTPEDLVKSKIDWIEDIMKAAHFIKIVEIPYDFTLTEEYMRGLFEHYVLSG